MTSLHEELLPEGGGVISLVGGGRKTTLMFRPMTPDKILAAVESKKPA